MQRPHPLRTDRLRTMERPFGWAPFRLLTSGLLTQLSPEARQLYLVLCLVADRRGLSFYGDKRLFLLLRFNTAQLESARRELMSRDLLAYDGRVYQLLSLPVTSTRNSEDAQGIKDILRRLGFGDDDEK